MSSKRKLRRAQQARDRAPSAAARSSTNKDILRLQLEQERFKVAGSEKLWPALLGWDAARVARAWLIQAVHDAAHTPGARSEASRRQFAQHAPEAAERLDDATLDAAIAVWRASGDAYQPDDPAPKWQLLANVCDRAELGRASVEEMQEDWELWTNLTLAGAPRKALMEALAQTERAALALDQLTGSDPVASIASVTRILWSAVAYGESETFSAIQRWTAEWQRSRQQ